MKKNLLILGVVIGVAFFAWAAQRTAILNGFLQNNLDANRNSITNAHNVNADSFIGAHYGDGTGLSNVTANPSVSVASSSVDIATNNANSYTPSVHMGIFNANQFSTSASSVNVSVGAFFTNVLEQITSGNFWRVIYSNNNTGMVMSAGGTFQLLDFPGNAYFQYVAGSNSVAINTNLFLDGRLYATKGASFATETNRSTSASQIEGTDAGNGQISQTLTAWIDAQIGSTRGSILERAAGGWTLILPGASGTFLGGNGPGAEPTYQTPPSGGSGSATNAFNQVQTNGVSASSAVNTNLNFNSSANITVPATNGNGTVGITPTLSSTLTGIQSIAGSGSGGIQVTGATLVRFTGSTSSTATNGFLEVINAEDFGLTSSGDQSAVLQAAINAAAVFNQALYIPAGQYLVTTQLWVPRIRVFGDSVANGVATTKGTTLYTGNNAIPAMILNGLGQEIDHISFQGNGASNHGIGIMTDTNYATPTTGYSIHDCLFYNQEKGIKLEDTWDANIYNNYFSQTTTYGIYSTNWANDIRVNGGHFASLYGIIHHGEGSNQAGRWDISSAFEVCSNAIVFNGSGWSGVNIHDTYFEGNTNCIIAGNGKKITIQNNWFGSVLSGGVNNTNIILVGTDHPTIINNYFYDSGYNIDATTFGLVDGGNRFEATASSRNQLNPITRFSYGSNIVLYAVGGGNFTNNGTMGVGGAMAVSGTVDFKNLGAGVVHSDSGGNLTSSSVANGDLANSSITLNGSSISLGGSGLAPGATPYFGAINFTNYEYTMPTNNGGGNALVAGNPGTASTFYITNITADTTLAAMTFDAARYSGILLYASCSGGTDRKLIFPANFIGSGALLGVNLQSAGITITNARSARIQIDAVPGLFTNVFWSPN